MKKRVLIPLRDTSRLVDLVTTLREKHVAAGDASPLKLLDWEKFSPLIDEAVVANKNAIQLNRQKLNAYQQRSLKSRELISFVRRSRDILTGVYDQETKTLGLWGFDVLDNRNGSPPKKDDSPMIGEV